ncbi:hypothetical protein GU3_16309 (plasmid) [Oceanimonas sp. GK1]|uniref:integrase domain-containing protein n=1 Tax=Oceanimonas sp. (strain GK1 / IBRC-M 10197) TaxID=511062 RepID=UPI0002495603|nr:integrase domain-containing protein [Oceanimonas sp. GK1]AEY02967.1 hypothetical protein GU3_16309 [Oceanimonas sp. GK1]
MSRNYGLGTRDMASAGRIALNRAASQKSASFSTAATVAERWKQFTLYAKEQGVGRMERITPELVIAYGQTLAAKVQAGDSSAAYAQNLVSAANTVMGLVNANWKSVSPTKDCHIQSRSTIRTEVPAGADREVADRAIAVLRDAGKPHAAAVAELARELGLRSKEAALLDASKAAQEAMKKGTIRIIDGTKGGRPRELAITNERQIVALVNAATLQGHERALIPPDHNWKTFREGELRSGRGLLQSHAIVGYHDLRSAYACERYEVLTGQAAPVFGTQIGDRERDREARMQLAKELGHGRIDVVSEYIGGRK